MLRFQTSIACFSILGLNLFLLCTLASPLLILYSHLWGLLYLSISLCLPYSFSIHLLPQKAKISPAEPACLWDQEQSDTGHGEMANLLWEPHYKKLHSGSIVTVEELKAKGQASHIGNGEFQSHSLQMGQKSRGTEHSLS